MLVFIIRLNVSLYSSPVLLRKEKIFVISNGRTTNILLYMKLNLLLLKDFGAWEFQLHVGLP